MKRPMRGVAYDLDVDGVVHVRLQPPEVYYACELPTRQPVVQWAHGWVVEAPQPGATCLRCLCVYHQGAT